MTQVVRFPAKVWGQLATIADNRGQSIADVIVDAARGLLDLPTPEPRCEREHVKHRRDGAGRPPIVDWSDPVVEERIRELHFRHHSMVSVARELGVSTDAVRTAYRHLNIPTNPKSTTNPKENAA